MRDGENLGKSQQPSVRRKSHESLASKSLKQPRLCERKEVAPTFSGQKPPRQASEPGFEGCLLSFFIQKLCQVLVEFVEINLYQTSGKDGFNVNMLSNQWLVGVFDCWPATIFVNVKLYSISVNCLAFCEEWAQPLLYKAEGEDDSRARHSPSISNLHSFHFSSPLRQ